MLQGNDKSYCRVPGGWSIPARIRRVNYYLRSLSFGPFENSIILQAKEQDVVSEANRIVREKSRLMREREPVVSRPASCRSTIDNYTLTGPARCRSYRNRGASRLTDSLILVGKAGWQLKALERLVHEVSGRSIINSFLRLYSFSICMFDFHDL